MCSNVTRKLVYMALLTLLICALHGNATTRVKETNTACSQVKNMLLERLTTLAPGKRISESNINADPAATKIDASTCPADTAIAARTMPSGTQTGGTQRVQCVGEGGSILCCAGAGGVFVCCSRGGCMANILATQ